METVVFVFLSSYVVTMVIGGLIGSRKGRVGAGIVWALLLGPIGWLIMVVVPDERPKCAACKGTIPADATKCMHCGSDVLPPVPPLPPPPPKILTPEEKKAQKRRDMNQLVTVCLFMVSLIGLSYLVAWMLGYY